MPPPVSGSGGGDEPLLPPPPAPDVEPPLETVPLVRGVTEDSGVGPRVEAGSAGPEPPAFVLNEPELDDMVKGNYQGDWTMQYDEDREDVDHVVDPSNLKDISRTSPLLVVIFFVLLAIVIALLVWLGLIAHCRVQGQCEVLDVSTFDDSGYEYQTFPYEGKPGPPSMMYSSLLPPPPPPISRERQRNWRRCNALYSLTYSLFLFAMNSSVGLHLVGIERWCVHPTCCDDVLNFRVEN